MNDTTDRSSSLPGVIAGLMAGLIAFVVAFVSMRSLDPMTATAILAGAVAGGLVNLPPFFMARSRNRPVFAQGALWAGIVFGGIGGAVLAVPLAVILSIVVWMKGPVVVRASEAWPA